MVQDGCFLPESSFRCDCQNICSFMCKNLGVLLRCKGCNRNHFRRSPGCQSSDFQANHLQGRSIRKQMRIGKKNRLLVLFVYKDVCLIAKYLRDFFLNLGAELLGKICFRSRICLFVKSILPCIGTCFPRFVFLITKNLPIQNQINVLRKTVNQIKYTQKSFSTMASGKCISAAVFRNSSRRSLSDSRATLIMMYFLRIFFVSCHKSNPWRHRLLSDSFAFHLRRAFRKVFV